MSGHSLKARRRHPDAPRERHVVGHVTFEIIEHPEHGITFALIAGDAVSAQDRRPLFSGHVRKGMASELRRLAHRFDDLEAKL